jgi:hypothetical protein
MPAPQNVNGLKLVVRAHGPEHLLAKNQITLEQWLAAIRGYNAKAEQPTEFRATDRAAA